MPFIRDFQSPALQDNRPFDTRTIEERLGTTDVEVEGLTLGEAFREYEAASGVSIIPHFDTPDAPIKFGSRAFRYDDGHACRGMLVGVSILRGSESLDTGGNLAFRLEPSDVIAVAALVS
ncbi:MAG: hypothetical protein JSR45_02740 [Proteobacteria bacterium]|nr:hypothetical protein [Pseudomonadota bacterium]